MKPRPKSLSDTASASRPTYVEYGRPSGCHQPRCLPSLATAKNSTIFLRRYSTDVAKRGGTGIAACLAYRASFCASGECVEVAQQDGMIILRDSTQPLRQYAPIRCQGLGVFRPHHQVWPGRRPRILTSGLNLLLGLAFFRTHRTHRAHPRAAVSRGWPPDDCRVRTGWVLTLGRATASGGVPCGYLGAGVQAEFGQDVLDVVFGGALGYVEGGADLPVGEPAGHETGDLALAAGQRPGGESG